MFVLADEKPRTAGRRGLGGRAARLHRLIEVVAADAPPWTTSGARAELRRAAARAGVRRRIAPHQLRHAHAVEMAREGVPLIVIQRQLGHSNLGITSVYLQGIDNAESIETATPVALR